jgi:hypothetical protein
VNAVEFQCTSPVVPDQRDDIRSVVVNVDRSEASSIVTGAKRAVHLNGPLVPARGMNRDEPGLKAQRH